MGNSTDSDLAETAEVIAGNLRAVLEARGMTPADLGRIASGSKDKSVYNALTGETPPALKKLVEYADALGVPVWTLLVPNLKQHKELLGPGALGPLARVVENYLACSPEGRTKIERMAQAMRDEVDLKRK